VDIGPRKQPLVAVRLRMPRSTSRPTWSSGHGTSFGQLLRRDLRHAVTLPRSGRRTSWEPRGAICNWTRPQHCKSSQTPTRCASEAILSTSGPAPRTRPGPCAFSADAASAPCRRGTRPPPSTRANPPSQGHTRCQPARACHPLRPHDPPRGCSLVAQTEGVPTEPHGSPEAGGDCHNGERPSGILSHGVQRPRGG
jgi:hypothetical protein